MKKLLVCIMLCFSIVSFANDADKIRKEIQEMVLKSGKSKDVKLKNEIAKQLIEKRKELQIINQKQKK